MSDSRINVKTQRQQMCYCGKKSIIQLGLKSNSYINVALAVGIIFLVFHMLISAGNLGGKFLLIGFLSILIFPISMLEYFSNKKEMLAAGHSRSCSRQIALQSVLYGGRWTFFAVVTPQEESEVRSRLGTKTPDTQMDYGAVAGGLWIVATMVNLFFVAKLVDGQASSVFYPTFFTFSIIASTALLIRIKGRKIAALVFSLLNLCWAAVMLTLYVLAAFFSYVNFSL